MSRHKRLYLLRGKRIMAVSKDEVLRSMGLKVDKLNMALVVKVKPRA
jgi:hypothetical protein